MSKTSFFKTTIGKVVIVFATVVFSLSIIVFAISNIIIEKTILVDTPAIVKDSFESAKVSRRILNKVGEEITSKEYGFDDSDPKNDTLKFHIKLVGDKASVTINTIATRKANQDWYVIKSDTAFTQ